MAISGQRSMEILNALFNKDRSALEIIEVVKDATNGRVKIGIGGIYTQLDRLEKAGLVKGYYGSELPEDRNGRPKRYYKLLGKGRAMLEEQNAIRMWRAI